MSEVSDQYFVSSNERWAIAPQVKARLLATSLTDYEHRVTQMELQLWQAQTQLPSLRIIRDSLRGALEKEKWQ